MKAAVRKLSAKYEEMFNGLSLSNGTIYLGAKLMIVETMLVLHSDSVISDEDLKEAMDEVDLIYPAK